MIAPHDGAHVDRLGLRILERLATNGRASYSDLGRELKLSVNTVRDRILAMERRGVIRGYHAVLDDARCGDAAHALCFLQAATESANPQKLPQRLGDHLLHAHRGTGTCSLVLELVAPDAAALDRILRETVAPEGYRVARVVPLGPRIDRIPVAREVRA